MDHHGKRCGRGRAGGLLVLAGSLLLAPPAFAGPNQGRISFSLGNDFTTAYFFRGILQERDGFIMQPYGEVDINLYSDADEKEKGPINSFTLLAGSWNSIQTKKTLQSGSGPSNWYESDFYAGFKTTLFENLELKPYYIAYTYPNGAFNTVQELDLTVSFNDKEWLGDFALYPSATVAFEVDNTALGTAEGSYLELNMRPTFTIIKSETYPVSLAIPLQFGLSLSDYYESPTGENNGFGFFKTGAVFSVPLAFIPEEYGAWSASAGASVYTFGENLKDYNQGDAPWVVGTWSINMSY